MIATRPAGPTDAAAACDVVRRSIRVLCEDDHRQDPDTLAAWLESKTPARFERIIAAPSRYCVVAVDDGVVVGFGSLKGPGEVGLLYVAPEAKGRGAGSLMLRDLEAEAVRRGSDTLSLNSSRSARGFYESRGYRQDGNPRPGFGITRMWPMTKRLGAGPGAANAPRNPGRR